MPTSAELVALRIAESDYYLGKRRQAREALRPMLDEPVARRRSALHLAAGHEGAGRPRRLHPRRRATWPRTIPSSPWAEEALNRLATDYITRGRRRSGRRGVPRAAAAASRAGRYAERAAWKVGWRAYRAGEFARRGRDVRRRGRALSARRQPAGVAVLVGPRARSARTTRSRPTRATGSWWPTTRTRTTAGWRRSSWRRGGEPAVAGAHQRRAPPRRSSAVVADRRHHPRAHHARSCIDDALREVQYAQRVWGDSPQLQATVGVDPPPAGAGARGDGALHRAARRHHHDAPRLSAVHGGRRRGAAAPTCCASSSRSTTGR